jgi:dienelactone hydrolase
MKNHSLFVVMLLLAFIQSPTALTETLGKPPNYAAQGAHVVQKLAAAEYGAVENRFDTRLAKDLPQTKLAEQWEALLAQSGPFIKVKATSVTRELGGYHIVVMTCAFQRAPNNNVLVTINSDDRIVGLYFGPQPTEVVDQWTTPGYALAKNFHEVQLTVENGPWRLPSTITLPNGRGPFPAVVLVPGSPPLDQDATLGPNKIFKDLAWGLASRGIAVLRYTKRTHQFGAGLGGGALSSFTLSEELGNDARAAISVMASRSDIDHRQMYLLGHSMGGVAVPPIAAVDPQIAGVVVMGTPAGDLLSVLLKRSEDGASQGGEEAKEASRMIPVLKKLRDGGYTPGKIVDLFGQRSPVAYWTEVRNSEPGLVTARLKVPVLVLVAGHDAEALPDAFESWKVALAGHKNATLKLYPDLFHLFLPSTATQKGDTPEDWSRPGHVTPEVVNDIASWVLSRRNDQGTDKGPS